MEFGRSNRSVKKHIHIFNTYNYWDPNLKYLATVKKSTEFVIRGPHLIMNKGHF